MARNRQRAKQRQAARRSSRPEDGGTWDGDERAPTDEPAEGPRGGSPNGEPIAPSDGDPAVSTDVDPPASGAANGDSARDDAALRAGAPSEATGRSDTGRRGPSSGSPGIPTPAELDDAEAAELDRQAGREPAEVELDPARPDREGVPADAGGRGRLRTFAAFCVSCWSELKRVQWPKRAQLFSLTGVVLGFCVIAGGYLGLLDFVFSRLIRAIL